MTNKKNPGLLDLVFQSPDLKTFVDLIAAQKYDRLSRTIDEESDTSGHLTLPSLSHIQGNWGHNVSWLPTGEVLYDVKKVEKWRNSEVVRKCLTIHKEVIQFVTRFSITPLKGQRKLSFLARIENFKDTTFSNIFLNNKDRENAVDILFLMELIALARKKLRRFDRRFHPFMHEIEKDSNYLLYHEYAAK